MFTLHAPARRRLMFLEEPAQDPAAGPAEPTPATEVATEDPDPAGAEALGDPGKKALDTMKAAKRAAEQDARDTKAALAALQAKLDGKEAEHIAEQERRQVEDAAFAKANERILKAEVRATAASKLTDPADALLYLNLTDFEVGDDGEVDTAAISAAIDDLVKAKPYLAAQRGTPGTVFESPGAHRKGAPAGQLTQSDLKDMSAEQIVQAKADGRLNTVLGIAT